MSRAANDEHLIRGEPPSISRAGRGYPVPAETARLSGVGGYSRLMEFAVDCKRMRLLHSPAASPRELEMEILLPSSTE